MDLHLSTSNLAEIMCEKECENLTKRITSEGHEKRGTRLTHRSV